MGERACHMNIKEKLQSKPKRDFLNEDLLPNASTYRDVALYKIAVDCSEDLEERVGKLTEAIDKASGKSTLLGIGLILVGLGTWALFGLEIYKIFWAK
jgi:hypothetical protein